MVQDFFVKFVWVEKKTLSKLDMIRLEIRWCKHINYINTLLQSYNKKCKIWKNINNASLFIIVLSVFFLYHISWNFSQEYIRLDLTRVYLIVNLHDGAV